MADGPRRGWMAGVWTVCVALALPALIPAWVAAQDRPRTDPQPGSSPIDIDRAWSAARERDATNIVSIISGAQIPATPTSNVPETLAALPSVSVERVLGEGRYVRVRGLQPRWSSVQLDGDRLPSVDGQSRATPLNILPAEFFDVIQISRTTTPDMDGDAIGGAINLVPRRPTEQTRGSFSLNGGYRGLRGDADAVGVNGMFGRRLAHGRVGVTAGGSALRESLSGNGFEAIYNDALLLDSFEVRSAVTDRTRAGGHGLVDVKLSDRTALTFSGIAGRLRDRDYDRDTFYGPISPNGSVLRALHDQPIIENLWSSSARGQHLLRGNATLDARVAVAQGRQREDGSLSTFYMLSNTPFETDVYALAIDPHNIQVKPIGDDLDKYGNGTQSLVDAVATDTSITAAANMTMPIAAAGPGPRVIKFGVKAHNVEKSQDRNFGNAQNLPPLASVVDANFDPGPILNGRYTLGPTVNPDLARQFGATLTSYPPDEQLMSDYNGRESTLSGYVMTDLAFGARFTLEPGVRYEWDRRRYHAWSVVRDWEPTYDVTPQDATTTHGEWLPMISARYAATARTTIRMAVTRTIARPNFSDLAPFVVGSFGGVPHIGNPNLRSTSSWNTDIMLDQELPRGSGRLFAGVFHKRIDDPIYVSQLPAISGAGFASSLASTFQPRNGDRASLTGLEMGYAQLFRFLPGPWAGLGVTASYTLSDSSAVVPGRVGDGTSAIFPDRPGHDVTLPGLPRHLGHVAVSYDHAGLSARMVATMQSSAMTYVGPFAWFDAFSARRAQLDFSLSHRLTSRLRAFVDVFNLTNADTRTYRGDPSRATLDEAYGRWASFGVRMMF